MRKVTIIGAGNVGSTIAYTLAIAAGLRGISADEAARQSRENAFAAFPRLRLRHVL